MSKSFLNFLCVVVILVIFFFGLSSTLVDFGGGWNPSWTTWSGKIGLFIFFLSFIPIYQLRKTITLVNSGYTDKRVLLRILLIFSWIIVPLIYMNDSFYSNLQCFESKITHSGALPARCYNESNPYYPSS